MPKTRNNTHHTTKLAKNNTYYTTPLLKSKTEKQTSVLLYLYLNLHMNMKEIWKSNHHNPKP